MSHHQLVDHSVFDRSGYLIGYVTRVEPLAAAGDFSLVVELIGDSKGDHEVTIANDHVHALDSDNKVIHVDFDHLEFGPQAGTKIQLLEERLLVNRKRVKVGEIRIRRVVETEIVEVPIQREKLVIERTDGSEPPIEVSLNDTQLHGFEVAAQGSHSEPIIGAQSTTANGSFSTIRDAIDCLGAVAQRSNYACEKVRAAIILNGNMGLKGTVYDFETPETAIQKLSRLENILLKQCSYIRLELFLKDQAMLPAYRELISQYIS
ncbi:MAG: YsnF/AvaK domain-containing protein [Nodosilinea sp.]